MKNGNDQFHKKKVKEHLIVTKELIGLLLALVILGSVSFTYGLSFSIGVDLTMSFDPTDYLKLGILWLPTTIGLFYIMAGTVLYSYALFGLMVLPLWIVFVLLVRGVSVLTGPWMKARLIAIVSHKLIFLLPFKYAVLGALVITLAMLNLGYFNSGRLPEGVVFSIRVLWSIIPIFVFVTVYLFLRPLSTGPRTISFIVVLLAADICSSFILGFQYLDIKTRYGDYFSPNKIYLKGKPSVSYEGFVLIQLNKVLIAIDKENNRVEAIPISNISHISHLSSGNSE